MALENTPELHFFKYGMSWQFCPYKDWHVKSVPLCVWKYCTYSALAAWANSNPTPEYMDPCIHGNMYTVFIFMNEIILEVHYKLPQERNSVFKKHKWKPMLYFSISIFLHCVSNNVLYWGVPFGHKRELNIWFPWFAAGICRRLSCATGDFMPPSWGWIVAWFLSLAIKSCTAHGCLRWGAQQL